MLSNIETESDGRRARNCAVSALLGPSPEPLELPCFAT